MFTNRRADATFIKDLESLIKDHVEGRIIKHEIRPLTEFGENFGSEMVRVEITVEHNGRESVVHTVAKLIPQTEIQMKVFDTQVTFKNEIAFYAEIVPTLKHFQKEQGLTEVLDYFPRLYGTRINLKNSGDEVDEDAIILMENLKTSGFENLDRYSGFDLTTTKLALRTFANFQATVTGLRHKHPDLFQSKVLPYIKTWTPPPTRNIESVIAENPQTAHLVTRVAKLFQRAPLRKNKLREPWATLTHNDAWVNNIMFKLSGDEIDDIKLVDFQIFDHASFACDLIFLLLSSVKIPVLKYHFDKLLRYYYDEFILTLLKLKVDTRAFTYESFQEELRIEAPFQVFHSLFMLGVIFGPKGMPKIPGRVREWNPNGVANGSDVRNHGPPEKPGGPGEQKLSTECREKLYYIVEEAANRNWL